MMRAMRRTALICAVAATLATPAPAASACPTQGDPQAAALAMEDPAVAARLLAPLSLWTKLTVSKGLDAGLEAQAKACERARFETASGVYVLRGDEDASALPRVATPARGRGVVAYLTPIPDLHAAMTAGRRGPAPALGYALLTKSGEAYTAWRIYNGLPEDRLLVADITDVIAGRIAARLRVSGDQVQIMVPKP